MARVKLSVLLIGIALLTVGCGDQYISTFDCTLYQERIEVTTAILVGFRTQIYPVLFVVTGAMGLVRMMRRA